MNEVRETETDRRRGPKLVAIFATLALPLVVVGKAVAASMVEYALLLVAVLLLAATSYEGPSAPNHQGIVTLQNHLQTDAQEAAFFHLHGNRRKEITALGKTLAAANGLVGLASTCTDCADAEADLQLIVRLASELQARAQQNACNPDGVVDGQEACDPSANPSGCPILVLPSFCNDDCECAIVPTGPVPCDLPFPAECDDACQCQPAS